MSLLELLHSALVAAFVAVPWLNPAAGGPSAVIVPWLVAAAASLLLWVLIAPQVSRRHLGAAIVLAALLAGLGKASPPVLLAVASLGVIALSASIASGIKTRPRMATAIANAWLIAALVSSVFAMAQYFGLSASLAPWVNPTSAGEAFANLRQRNHFATLTSIGLAALLWQRQRGSRVWWAYPGAALLAVANAASASRTGALQIGLVAVLTLWWCRPFDRRVAGVCLIAVLAYGAAAVSLPLLLEQLTGLTAPNALGRWVSSDGCASRTILWGNVLHLIAQKPWWGWGWGELDYAHFATLYPGPRFCDILDNAHNLPLHLAVELGIPAATLAIGGFGVWVVRQRPWHETDPTRRMAWSVIAVILLHSLLEYPLWYGPFQMAFGFSLGLLATGRSLAEIPTVGWVGRATVSTSLAIALLFSALDYHRVSQLYTPPDERSGWSLSRPLARVGDSWLFRDQLAFAELSTTPLTRENAVRLHALAMELLHYSPEPRVIDIAIESAVLLQLDGEAGWLLARYRAAFPDDYEKWSKAGGLRRWPAGPVKD